MYTLGYDIGSSSVKVTLLDLATGRPAASAFSPKTEMPITAVRSGWAEQHPDLWWNNLKQATAELFSSASIRKDEILAVGISYQMHGLVLLDENTSVLRPAIIWCDSRAVEIGEQAFADLGKEYCLRSYLNSPGNFTASKLRWVAQNEPELFRKVKSFFLPGDYIAERLTGDVTTTASGLSEGILWDYRTNSIAQDLLSHYEIPSHLVPQLVPTFGDQGRITKQAAEELGLPVGIPVSYRAGDQPNNALSLNVMEPGELAATAGTSGVVYGVSDAAVFDQQSRVNSFVHVNHRAEQPRIGVLLCINGCGIANSWIRRMLGLQLTGYERMNALAAQAPIGSGGVVCLPFGNGAERMLANKDIGAHLLNARYNSHSQEHLARAVQEGIAASFRYGIEIMKHMRISASIIRAGEANLFLSPLFREALANIAGVTIELYNTDGAQGAARGAAHGIGFYASREEMFNGLTRSIVVEPTPEKRSAYDEIYGRWLKALQAML